jgi:hypothetical protein
LKRKSAEWLWSSKTAGQILRLRVLGMAGDEGMPCSAQDCVFSGTTTQVKSRKFSLNKKARQLSAGLSFFTIQTTFYTD